MPPFIEQRLRSLLGKISDELGDGYVVTLVARHKTVPNADIVLGNDKATLRWVSDRLNIQPQPKKEEQS